MATGMLRVAASVGLLGLAVSLAAQDAPPAKARTWRNTFEEGCGTLEPLDENYKDSAYAGLIWCGGAEIDRHELAILAAPILWFSPDEPLKNADRRTPICKGQNGPAGLPEPWSARDCTAGQGVVYYYISNRRHAGLKSIVHDRIDLREHPLLFANFLFYYHRDLGLNPHRSDLEAAQFELRAECSPPGSGEICRIRIAGVKGFAHGLNWAANRLKILKSRWLLHDASAFDTILPITLLVEEGKHATCTDRNGDGHYTPGVDVNVAVNDAWGVRDSLGSGVLSRTYGASQTKPRKPDDRWAPADRLSTMATALRHRYEERHSDAWPPNTYNLEEACPRNGECPARIEDTIRAAVKAEEAAAVNPATDRGEVVRDATEEELDPLGARFGFWKKTMERLPFSARFDHGTSLSIQVPYPAAVPLLGLMAAPRIVVRPRGVGAVRAAGLVVSPSVSRWLDWYGGVGWQRFEEGDGLRSSFVSEFGLRVRLRPIWLRGNLPMVGLRLGIQFRDLHAPRHGRLVVELGSGFL